MELNINIEMDKTSGGQNCPSNVKLRWAVFFFFLLLIWTFIFVIAPALQRLPLVQPLAEYINQNDIDADALFYTEVEEVGEAETNIRNTLKFLPHGP